MGGHTVPAVLGDRCCRAAARIVPLYFELDGIVPQPRGQPARPGEPGRPAGGGPRARRRPRPGLRRRRRPLLRGRRARRPGLPVGDHRAGRRPRAGQAPRRDDHPQPDHLARRAGDRRRARRRPGPHPGRALVHQGRDGPHRRGLRRRALGALLLPRLLVRRHRHARRDARARRARRAGRAAVARCGASTSGTSPPARSTRRSTTRQAA